ncbi:hypothetical protein HYT45_02035 [Candidatus Uhrbacteria bacterium]|nr:hypothetical protein [Candidatus Uhrbacteria bacterium]
MNQELETLNYKPFELSAAEKKDIFFRDIKSAVFWHYENSEVFRKICEADGFEPSSAYALEDIPFLSPSMFKAMPLSSVPPEEITKTLFSSSTSGEPSKIMLDRITSNRQIIALNRILADFFGSERGVFLIFDTEKIIKSPSGELSSRGAAVMGMLGMAKKSVFLCDDDLRIDGEKIKAAREEVERADKVFYFGFTWLLYNFFSDAANKENFKSLSALSSGKQALALHIGGWKKLKDMAVSREQFNERAGAALGIPGAAVRDIYGMTEQLGTVYPDCQAGFKHAPLYSDIIVRDKDTLLPSPPGKSGLMQFLSPIPRSYPGISVLSDDIGSIAGIDDCPCGRKGKYFVFEKRSEAAELRGCGDVLRL